MNEFLLIEQYFVPLTMGRAEAGGLEDDAAILNIPKGYDLVVTSDTLNEGVHFLRNEKPEFIAHKALRVNLSDLAAMGAAPYAYQLCIGFRGKPKEAWVKSFTAALLKDQKEFGIFCSGGDTTVTKGPLSVSITAFGLVPKGKAVRRNGAKPGDMLVITGPVGDALIGLKILQKKIKINSAFCIDAYRKPVPRVAVSNVVRKYAHAAIDISDGLVADARHLCEASGCAAKIDLEAMRFSPMATRLMKSKRITVQDLLTGGDDYELALAVPRKNVAALIRSLAGNGLNPQVIGEFSKGKPDIRVYHNGGQIKLAKNGWSHF